MQWNIESFRRCQLAAAEMIDAWRIFPRLMVICYMVLVYDVVTWYMSIETKILTDCPPDLLGCIVEAPSNQHAMLVTSVIGFSAAIFGFYANTGKRNVVPPKQPTREDDGY